MPSLNDLQYHPGMTHQTSYGQGQQPKPQGYGETFIGPQPRDLRQEDYYALADAIQKYLPGASDPRYAHGIASKIIGVDESTAPFGVFGGLADLAGLPYARWSAGDATEAALEGRPLAALGNAAIALSPLLAIHPSALAALPYKKSIVGALD